jgi:LytS/YehU family sensor histidine kinase
MNWLRYFVRPAAYLLAGGAVSVWLMRPLLESAGTGWFFMLLPLLLLTLLLTTIGLVGVWVHYQTWTHEEVMTHYPTRQLLGLHLRCFCCLAAGCLLAAVIYLVAGLLQAPVRALVSGWLWVAYALCAALTGIALLSVFRGETLQEVRLRHAQSENLWLRSQLNPHFLYNTLNNIDALIWTAPERASEAVIRLSGLMRYLTESAARREVPLSDEVRLLEELVALQRLRMAHADALRLTVDVDAPELPVAPLLLMPLVENTFKHVGDLSLPGAICISLTVHGRRLVLTTDNVLKPATPTSTSARTTGVGLAVLRRRLTLLYPGRHALTTLSSGGRYRTELSLQL